MTDLHKLVGEMNLLPFLPYKIGFVLQKGYSGSHPLFSAMATASIRFLASSF